MGGTDQGSWLQANQVQANAVADPAQISVQSAGTQAWAAALNALPPGQVSALGLVAKDVAAIVADAAGGAIIASSDVVVSALSTIGIATVTGAEAGPYGAAVGAVVGVVVAVATMPQASGSGPVPVSAQELLQQAYLNGVDAFDLVNWFWDVKIIADNPSAGQGPGFHVDLTADYDRVVGFYLAQINPIFPTDAQKGQAFALGANAMARMPPPDLMAQLLQANGTAWGLRGWPLPPSGVGGASDYGVDQLSPGSLMTLTSIFAASAMTGAYPSVMVSLCKSLESAFNKGFLGGPGQYDGFADPRIAAMQQLEAYYGTAKFQGLGPPPLPPGWWNLHLHNIPQGGGAPAPSVVTPATVAVAVPVVAVAGSLIYDYVRKQAMGTAMKKGWARVKRAVRGRR